MIRASVCLSTVIEEDGEAVEGREEQLATYLRLRNALDFIGQELRNPTGAPEFSSYPIERGDWLTFYGDREEPDEDEISAALTLHLTPPPKLASLKRLGRLLGAYGVDR